MPQTVHTEYKLIEKHYAKMFQLIPKIRELYQKPLTITEKILFSHLYDPLIDSKFIRGKTYVNFKPDRVALQDVTAQMAILQFINSNKNRVSIPTTLHCDHLIQAYSGANDDLNNALNDNEEIYDFLKTASKKYGIGFWKPDSGIIHQVVLENYAFPGGMMIGTDSHTPNAGGLGMIAIGVGGADAVDAMAAMPFELKMPTLIGIKLTGKLSGWSSPKDVILKVADILTVKGGTGSIIEYFGEGAKKISCTGKATICNMGAEIGATTSVFGFDHTMYNYLVHTNRKKIADLAQNAEHLLNSDIEILQNPKKYYDKYFEINLSELEPYINGPFTPDLGHKLSEFSANVKKFGYPTKLEVGLIGSCTNSSYEDLARSASIAKQAIEKKLKTKAKFIVTPGSEMIKKTTKRDNILQHFLDIGGTIMANACGPCIGQWKRHNENPNKKNSIMTSFNRNFAKRNDGNPNTLGFVASPEIVTAFSIAGTLNFNPLKDKLSNTDGEKVTIDPPKGNEFPKNGFLMDSSGYIPPTDSTKNIKISIKENSHRLQFLQAFDQWDGKDIVGLILLIKVKGKCTTDHISMAGPWLRFRGHLDKISDNLLIGATNYFNNKTNLIYNHLTKNYDTVPTTARNYKAKNMGSIIIGDENYGEGSSREHAAMEPRHLEVRVVVARSFARIHETNLKKQGILALTFVNGNDYERILEKDSINIKNLNNFKPGKQLLLETIHTDGSKESFLVNHSYNELQIKWFKYGSTLNYINSLSK